MGIKYIKILTFLCILLFRLFLVTIFDSSSRLDRILSHTVAMSSTWHDRASLQISANCCVILSLTWLSTWGKKNHFTIFHSEIQDIKLQKKMSHLIHASLIVEHTNEQWEKLGNMWDRFSLHYLNFSPISWYHTVHTSHPKDVNC
jgi:hypothetical protein